MKGDYQPTFSVYSIPILQLPGDTTSCKVDSRSRWTGTWWNRQPGWNGWMSTHCGKIVTLFLPYIQIGIDRRTYGYKIANASERIHVLNSKIGIYLKLQVKKECPFNRHWTSLVNFTTKMRVHLKTSHTIKLDQELDWKLQFYATFKNLGTSEQDQFTTPTTGWKPPTQGSVPGRKAHFFETELSQQRFTLKLL